MKCSASPLCNVYLIFELPSAGKPFSYDRSPSAMIVLTMSVRPGLLVDSDSLKIAGYEPINRFLTCIVEIPRI
jgi:hypothetical protein